MGSSQAAPAYYTAATGDFEEDDEPLQRRGKFFVGGTYSMSLAVSDSHDFVGEFSGRGFSVEMRYFVLSNLSVGFMSGWQASSEKVRGTYTSADYALTGTQLRYFDAVPILATAYYHFDLPSPTLVPFVGLGVGTYWTRRQVNIGYLNTEDSDWHFGLAPDVGFLTDLGKHLNLLVDVRFNYAVPSTETYFTFNIGLMGY